MKKTPEFMVTPRKSLDGYERIDIEQSDARVGNVRCRFMSEKVVIYSIQVFPEYQGNDYGTAAIEMLKGRFSVIVADRVRFTARDFWEKMGFKEQPDGNWVYRHPA